MELKIKRAHTTYIFQFNKESNGASSKSYITMLEGNTPTFTLMNSINEVGVKLGTTLEVVGEWEIEELMSAFTEAYSKWKYSETEAYTDRHNHGYIYEHQRKPYSVD